MMYIIMLYFLEKILNLLGKENPGFRTISKKIIILFSMFSPIIVGYYHALLTEFIAITLVMISLYENIKYLYKPDKETFAIICGLTIFSYHLKQPYVTITIAPFTIIILINIIKVRTLKNFCRQLISYIIILLVLILSIQSWNIFLEKKGVNLNTERNVTKGLGTQILHSVNNLEIDKDINNISKLNSSDKIEFKNNPNNYVLINIYNDDYNRLEHQYIIKKNNTNYVSTTNAICFIFKIFITHPGYIIKSYTNTYLALVNIFPKETNDGVSYYIKRKASLNYCHEICSIAFQTTKYRKNVYYLSEELYNNARVYEQENNPPYLLFMIYSFLEKIDQRLFSISILLMPVFILYTFFKTIVEKNKKDWEILMLLLSFSFLHILSNIVTGLNIDRYIVVVYLPTIISEIYILTKIVKGVKHEKKRGINHYTCL